MRILLTAILVVATHLSFAQSKEGQKKSSYVLINCDDKLCQDEVEMNLRKIKSIEEFRFIDQRRVISISGSDIQIELKSGRELETEYGKKIHAQNIPFTEGASELILEEYNGKSPYINEISNKQ